ncbi:hypothetical protein GJW-30_1_01420 [Variibacter gotjawalensis]|uniref:Uncharacterized protein n=1 Tax=Variibacter gotjawalensis TaxID=1333996 RepID=A0A0S3PSP1_9BRAD|nr:hypothetical protein [Variibacter gotjawalensis]NIK49204.1 multidrug resistance efflux pump [Variibacter gotjawalensis]RZS51058.1 hypothetical protein EV661_3531 [Variibacter gotjawalensis]BAT58892.1 hypothetical protein GJW-30_1_01420 [Variibacter gotjawalensis]
MAVKGFAEQVQQQQEVWQAQIKDYQAKLEAASGQAKEEYAKALAQLQAQSEAAKGLAAQAQAAGETAWNDMKTASEKAFAEMQKGWADALSRFNK